MLVYGKCECFVMQMLYVCVSCAFCGSMQLCVLRDLQLFNAVHPEDERADHPEDERADHMEEAYSRAGLMTAL